MIDKINLHDKANNFTELFQYIGVGRINDHMLNIVCVENRTLDFHIHEDSDELFYVIEGQMQIELDDGLVNMDEGDLIIIPKGTRHRPVCGSLVKCLLMEKDGTLNQENTGGTYHS